MLALDALDQFFNLQVFYGDAVQRVERTVQHVVQTFVDARTFEGDDGQRVLDDADRGLITLVGAADAARLNVRDVAAHRAEVDGGLHVDDRLGQFAHGLPAAGGAGETSAAARFWGRCPGRLANASTARAIGSIGCISSQKSAISNQHSAIRPGLVHD